MEMVIVSLLIQKVICVLFKYFLLNVKNLFIAPNFSLPPKNSTQNKSHKCGLKTLRSSKFPMEGNLLRTSKSLNVAIEVFAT